GNARSVIELRTAFSGRTSGLSVEGAARSFFPLEGARSGCAFFLPPAGVSSAQLESIGQLAKIPTMLSATDTAPAAPLPVACDILFVDDDVILRAAFSELLRLQGFSVQAVGSGREALAFLVRQQPR